MTEEEEKRIDRMMLRLAEAVSVNLGLPVYCLLGSTRYQENSLMMSREYITNTLVNFTPHNHDAFAAFVDHVQKRGYQYGQSQLVQAYAFFLDGWKLSRAHVIKQLETFTERLK